MIEMILAGELSTQFSCPSFVYWIEELFGRFVSLDRLVLLKNSEVSVRDKHHYCAFCGPVQPTFMSMTYEIKIAVFSSTEKPDSRARGN